MFGNANVVLLHYAMVVQCRKTTNVRVLHSSRSPFLQFTLNIAGPDKTVASNYVLKEAEILGSRFPEIFYAKPILVENRVDANRVN